jgi:uncharacterized flavoprotein (TIGR03862 family)
VKFDGAVVIGAGPAGLWAAEALGIAGITVWIFDHKPSLGRKFLVAGRGGLNITHSEELDLFASRYDNPKRWAAMLQRFPPHRLKTWFEELGVPTYIGTSGRVFPRSMRAPEILERWLERLYELGCDIRLGYKFHQLSVNGRFPEVVFQRGLETSSVDASAVIFALGGASWPQTGSDGQWAPQFAKMGVRINPFSPSNVGWEYKWSSEFLSVADGKPLKNLAVTCAGQRVRGELLITKYGLEGGALYQLSRQLKLDSSIEIDFKPDLTDEELQKKWRDGSSLHEGASKYWRLSPAAIALIDETMKPTDFNSLLAAVRHCNLRLHQPRPIDEAISSAGGVDWSEFDDYLMLRQIPGVFCAGEMIDWDAPTGGYLLQGCYATGKIAGEGAVKWIAQAAEA